MTDPAKISYKFYGLFVLLLLLPVSAQAQKFIHAYSSISALNATFWIIQDAGFAKQEGLETELVYIPSSSTVAQATLAGEIVISPANGQVIADVGLQGGDLIADSTPGQGTCMTLTLPETRIVRRGEKVLAVAV